MFNLIQCHCYVGSSNLNFSFHDQNDYLTIAITVVCH